MDDLVQLFVTGQREFGRRVHAIGDRWSAPTPDEGWSVADLVDHLIDEHRWVTPLLDGQDLHTAGEIVAGTRDPGDREQAWADAARSSYRSVSAHGALARDVVLSRGSTPVADYLAEMIFDLTVHSWDLGRAIDFDGGLDDSLVDFSLARAPEVGTGEASTFFAAPVDIAADASPLDRLIARTGRDPRR
jgi:uncharacterized protein (TIGR03086 family)